MQLQTNKHVEPNVSQVQKKNGVDEITHYSDQFSLSWVLQMTKTNT